MNKLILPIMALTFSTSIFADDHKSNKNTDKSRMNHPNHLLNFKECRETKDAVGTFLAMADKAWKEVEEDINNEEEWAKASFLASQAAHYSTVYDVWCKDMINKRVKMGMAKKMKGKKKKEG